MFTLQTFSFHDFPWRQLFLLLEATFVSTLFGSLSVVDFLYFRIVLLLDSLAVSMSLILQWCQFKKISRMRMNNYILLLFYALYMNDWYVFINLFKSDLYRQYRFIS